MDQEKEERYAGAEQGRGAVYDNYGYQAELASRLHPGWPNGQKQVYVSQSTLYDSWSNMPGEEEGSTVNCKRCLLVLGIILLISGIIAGIVLAIYFSQRDTYVEPKSSPTGNTLPPTIGTTAAPSVRKKFAVNMTTAGTFDPELNDPNSQKYKDKAKEYENKMDDVYKNSSLSDKYKGTEVKGFSKGSIIVQAEISFDVPTVVNSSGSVTIPADVNATTVKALILQSADDLNLEKNNTDLVTATEIIEKETTAAPIVTTQQPATPKVTEMVTTSKPDIPITEPNTPEQPITTAPSESVTESNIVTTTAQQTSNALDITDEPATEYKETTMTPFMTTLSNVNISDDGSCNPGLASCRNSQCIRRDWFCDKHIDCLDGSDENDAQCGRNTTTPPTPMPKLNGKDLDCNFDSHAKELCNYKASPGGYNWSVIQGPTSSNKTGPDYDHTTFNPKGRFLFTESSYGSPNDNATMTSVIVTTDGSSRSLTFYYHMYGAHMGVLEVYFNIVKQKDFERVLKWKESGNHGNIWLKACIAMPKNTKLSVEFIAYRGLNYTSDIAIDDIKYSTDKCESVSCTFEDSDCGYPMLSNDNNDGSWRRVRGENMVDKPSAPATDFTLGTQYGAYMVADSSNNKGINPVFGTTLINVSQITTLNFRLYISGTGSAPMKLNLQTRSGFNLTFTKYSNPKVWTRACVPVPKDFYGTADFQAGRTSGAPRYVAVDDIALGPESSCEGFTGCRFENGLFCNFDVTGTTYRWRRFSGLKDDYVVANGEGLEGTITSLVTPQFVPTANSSLNFRYAIKGTSILSVWVRQFNEGSQSKKKIWTTEGMMNGVQTTPIKAENINSRTQKDINDNNNMDWLTGCFDIPLGNITIEIVSRKIDRNGGEVAINWVEVVNKPCKIGLDYTPCNFDDPNICGYVIDCPFNTQYKWKRISGSTPTLSTGPLRDHSYNSTIGNYLYTEGTDGRAGDKAIVTFMNVETARNTSLRFYYYMSGRDIGSLYITIGKTSGEISWIQAGGKSPSWYFGCVDLPSNQNTNISFTGVRGDGPVSDIAIDDVHLLDGKCPDRSIACDFENEMMCGYTGLSIRDLRVDKSFNEQWVRRNGSSSILPQRDHTLNSSNGNFLFTENPSKIISPRIPYGQTMCLQFYYYIQLGKGQDIKVITDYVDKAKNKEKVIGIYGYSLAQWRHAQMTLEPGNVSVIFSVERYKQEISSTFFAIDDVSMDFKKCPETVCADKMYKCKKDDFCIPEYKKCDWIQDCSDGADEQNCPADMATIRLINGVTSGDQGRLEIYVNGSWGTAYSLRWFENNAKVACRELGYTGFYKTIRFGKFFFGLGDVWQINCDGNETSIQDCDKVNVSSTIPHLYDVGLACYNTVCEPGKRDCPKVANSTVVYCLHQNQFCDGDFDCPGGEDENNCSNCRNNEFSCKNHQCIPESSRCDGKADCKDASDEMDCVRRDVEGNVEVFHNDSWMPLCYGTNNAFHSSLCLIMGQGVAKRKIMVNSTALGLVPHPSHTMTAVGKYKLSVSSKACPKMKLECYGQECGRRSKKVVASFVQFGSQAIPAEYPWQVMLLRNGKFHCGASIFNSRWLITAEHCVVERYVKYEVVAGLLRMQDLSKFPRLQIIQIVHSMNYGNNKGIPINDIALILLEKDLVFTEYIQPVCLPSKKYTSEDYCYLSGWGRDENLVGQSHLKETKVYANTSEECKKYYDNITDNSFLCFSHKQPNMPSCYGDSGGPLVCRNDRGRFELVGVVSFGLPLCAAANGTPAAFTNVLNFRGWIVDQTRCKMWCPDGKCLYEAETCDGIDHCRDRSDETAPKCSPTVACNFGKGYKCGYRNDSATPWYWSSPHWSTPNMKSKPMIGGDTETDEYMLASVKATKSSPARLISPSTTEIPCVSFKYLANANNSAKTVLILKAFEQNTTYKTVWDNGKNSTQEQLFWKLATVSLPNKTTHLMFEAYYENPDEYSFIAIDSVKVMDNNCTVCSATEFQCNSGHCINATQVCDGIQQCNDASDEMNCFKPTEPVGCNIDHFQCSNGQCVLKDKKCNGLKDCRDGSDEINCTRPTGPCSWDQFRCSDGQCIEDYLKCDGVWHCKDGSDEMYCHKTTIGPPGNCNWDQFRCDDGKCIQSYFKCDGITHCQDNSDEKYCFRTSTQYPGICKWNEFRCNNGQCIDFQMKCDNKKQCKDGSDEQYCGDKSTVKPGGCTWDQYRCDNGQCIQAFLRCDRLWHCKDGSDEQNCPLSTQIPEPQCEKDQYRCSDGFCILGNLRCDGIWHCIDGSDEESCLVTTTAAPAHCRWDQFRCNDGNCIESHRKCDGENNCKDGSDERYCYRTSTEYPGPCLLSQFRCNNGQCIESFLKCDKVKHCKDGSDEQYCDTATIQPQGICRWDQFRCKDGQCIPYHHKCDQIWHCRDGSDEQNCPKALVKNQGCKYNEFGCLDGKCIEIKLVCNRNKDCSLGEDEHNCTNATYPMPTAATTILIPQTTNARPTANTTPKKTGLVKGIHPLVTKTIILPGRSTVVSPVTAAPLQRGTKISIPPVTEASIQRSTRSNVTHVTSTPIRHVTRIHIPLVTATPIRRGTRILIPIITTTPHQRSDRFNITLVTAAPIQRGTRFNITLVTEAPLQRSSSHVTSAPIQRSTRSKISHVTTTSKLRHKTDSPHLMITPLHPKSDIPNISTITTKHPTKITVSPKQLHHKTTKHHVSPKQIHHKTTKHHARITISPKQLHHKTTKHHARITISPKQLHHKTPKHYIRTTVSPKKIHHKTNKHHARITISPKQLHHKTTKHHARITISPKQLHHKTPKHYIRTTVSPKQIHHKTTKTNILQVTESHTPRHMRTLPRVPVTRSHHDRKEPSTTVRAMTVPPKTATPPHHKTKIPLISTNSIRHDTDVDVPYVTATPPSHHITTHSDITAMATTHHNRKSFPKVTAISTDHKTKNIPLHVATTSAPHHKTPPPYATKIVDHRKRTSTHHVRQTPSTPSRKRHPHLTTTDKPPVTHWIPLFVTTRSKHHLTSSVTTPSRTTTQACAADEFRCNERQCIPAAFVCDVIPDCDNAKDELGCDDMTTTIRSTKSNACLPNEFECDQSQCVPNLFVCDDIPDCDNGRDESECEKTATTRLPKTCQAQEYRCNNGECILKSKRCDRMIDCSDESDELDCGYHTTPTPTPAGCAADEFRCDEKQCIPASFVCDVIPDCDNAKDELDCDELITTVKTTKKSYGFSGCRFENGLFCNFVVNGTNYKWKSVNQMKGDYVVANGDAPNGTSTSLISPEFTPTPNSSLTFRYAIIGTSILSVWVTQINNGNSEKREIWTTEGMMNGVQTTNMTSLENNMVQNDASNNSNNMDWLTGCFDIPMADKVSIEIVSRRMDQTGGVVALNWVEINNNPCKIGLDYTPCNFDDPNICGYTIDCPHNVKYKWKRISGSSPIASTGPQTDHTFNTTIGNYLYTKGSVGSPGEKAIVTFMDVQTVENASLRFYYYMSGRDIGSLNIIVGSTSGNVSWARKGEKSPFWSFGCMDLPSNEKTNISFIGIRGNGPLSDIAIDDVQLFNGKCPACQAQEYRCSNGECILGSKRCDYTLDCSDNSDEQNCIYPTTTTKPTTMVPTTMVPTTMVPTTNACTQNQWRCSGSKCIPINRRCDGFNDCVNGDDEKNCPTQSTAKPLVTTPGVPQTTIACTQNQWRCSGSKCISIGKRCDGFIDCVNGDDEKNCPTQSTAKPLVTTPGITQTTIACTQNQWRCSGSKCISIDKRCDGFNDCVNGDDEKNCPTQSTAKPLVTTPGVTQTTIACTQNQWRCSGSKCIPINRRCDGFNDCVNGDDEKNCPTQSTAKPLVTTPGVTQTTIACAQNKWRCPEGNCIKKISRCDGFDDCTGGADENNCPAQSQLTALKGTNTKGCMANQFRCDNGDCIPMSKFCNKIQDCRDGSDENCSHSRGSKPRGSVKGCSYDDFRCDNGQCIPLSFHCDGLFDCDDKSDEKNCNQHTSTMPSIQGCLADEFRCKNTMCIQQAFVCDGLFDCPDSSDEENCLHTTSTRATSTTEFMICRQNEFECLSGKCINAIYVCDGVPDCPSADDEDSCKVSTSSPEVSIPSPDKCFPLEVKECLKVGYTRTLLPNVFGDKTYAQATERFYTKAMPIIKQNCSKKTLMLFCGTIFPLCKNGVSKYTCKSVCKEIEKNCGRDLLLLDTCDWLVDDKRWCFIGLTGIEAAQVNHTASRTTVHPITKGCLRGYYQCRNSNICLHPYNLCDGEPACPEGDDEEENCSCLSNQFRCTSGQCVMKARRCNGLQDCRDYSDERNCSATECAGRLCTSGQCVPSDSFCNGVFDCDDLSDEKLCECKLPHRRCDNQVCITGNKWCNREDDCGDNSDEKNCDCSIGELMCSNGKCIPMEWWCDGNWDCSDGKDEAHCHQNLTTTVATTPTTITTTVPTTPVAVFPFKDNCKPDEFICTRGYKCINRTKVCDMNWDCIDGEDEATCVSLRKDASVRNGPPILTLTVQGQTSMVCSSRWSTDWASFICKYLRHKSVKRVDFVNPPPGTIAFQQVPSHQLEFPQNDFIKTTRTCETNKIVRMECNERICGTNRHFSIKYQDFIIGGDLARRYTWPWTVSLLYLGEPICGATLISERWLVTAAHCIVTGMWNRTKVPHYFSAILGEVDLFKGLMNGTRIPIDKIVLPGDLKMVVFNPDPDIALLRLKYPVQRDRKVEPICMAKLPKHDHGSTCYLAGWGGTHRPGEDRRRYSNFLHEVRMIIRNNSDCSTFRPQPNWEHNICAGYLESTITGCYGDNGGALMCWEPDNRWTLVGILSKGRYNCAANSPNVFTKVGPMRDWIEASMGWTAENEF